MDASSPPTREDIVALERAYWDAIQRKDGQGTAALSGEDAIVAGPRGVMSIPRAKMASMTEEGNWTLEDYAFDDVKISIPSPDVAIIAYVVRQTMTMDGQRREMRAADTSTWVRGRDGWRCHAHSETLLQ